MEIRAGQNALVTGASRGLGVYIARRLAHLGVNVVLAARSREALESLAEELNALGVKAIPIQADMNDESQVRSLYTRTMQELGHLDILINNAGIELVSDYQRLSAEEIRRVIEVNLTAPMLLTHLALPDMYTRDIGHIVNIASAAGTFPPPLSEPYAATKAGLIGFTESVRLSARLDNKKVSASVIAPGYMDDAGMYEDMKEHARRAPWFIGSLPAETLADLTIKVIEKDLPFKFLMPGAPTLLRVLLTIAPRFMEWSMLKMQIFGPLVDTARFRNRN